MLYHPFPLHLLLFHFCRFTTHTHTNTHSIKQHTPIPHYLPHLSTSINLSIQIVLITCWTIERLIKNSPLSSHTHLTHLLVWLKPNTPSRWLRRLGLGSNTISFQSKGIFVTPNFKTSLPKKNYMFIIILVNGTRGLTNTFKTPRPQDSNPLLKFSSPNLSTRSAVRFKLAN